MRSELIKKAELSYASFVLAYFRDLAKHAVKQTRDNPTGGEADGVKALKFHGAFAESDATSARGAKTISFGHPAAGSSIELSQQLLYHVRYEFSKENDDGQEEADGEEWLKKVDLTLTFLNPRLSLLKDGWAPAVREVVDGVSRFRLLSEPGTSPIGLAFELDGTDKPTRFKDLKKDLDEATLTPPSGFEAYTEDNLVYRLDLKLSWNIPRTKGFLDKIEDLFFDAELGIPNADVVDSGNGTSVKLYHEASPGDEVDGIVHSSRKLVLELADEDGSDVAGGGISWVNKLTPPKEDASADVKAQYRERLSRRVEFGLGGTFEGLLLDRLGVAWLNGDGSPTEKIAGSVSRAAISFGGSGSQFYFTAEVRFGPALAIPLIDKAAAPLVLRARFEASSFRYATIEGNFRSDLDSPWKWLRERTFGISIVRIEGKKPELPDAWGLELAISGGTENRLFKFDRPSDAGDSPIIDALGSALAVGPWVFEDTREGIPPNLQLPQVAADPHRRGMWHPIGGANDLTAPMVTSIPIAELFLDKFDVSQIVIRAAYLRVQQRPKEATDSPDVIDTALLFDYDVTFDLKLPKVEAEGKNVTASTEGLGFVIPTDSDEGFWPFAIVLIKDGRKEVGISDPKLWKIPLLDKIVSVTQVQLRKKDQLFLVFDLGMTKGFKYVTVDNFRVAWAIAGDDDDDDDDREAVEVYPSKITVDIPGAVKGVGEFDISDDENGNKAIRGGIDLTLVPLELRIRLAARIETLVDKDGREQLAIVVAGDVTFPSAIPLGAGIGLKTIGVLYASHFERVEKDEPGGFSPAMGWLQSAQGDVVGSVFPSKKALWQKAFDRYSFGAGATLVGHPAEELYSFNGMVLVELPGPRILIIVKVKLVSKVKSTKEEGKEKTLTKGIQGVIDLDFERQQYSLSALLDFEFIKLLQLKIPFDASFSSKQGNNWHIYFGMVKQPVTMIIDIKVRKVTIKGYLMFEGDELTDVPGFDGNPANFEGFAIAFGASAEMTFGSGKLKLEVSAFVRLLASFGGGFTFIGQIGGKGELHLFIVDIAASADFVYSHLAPTGGATENKIGGSVCGKIKIWFVKLEGCIDFGDRKPLPPSTKLEDLITGVHLQSGAPILLQGQGIVEPIDAMIAPAVDTAEGWSFDANGTVTGPEGKETPRTVPVDVVIVARNRQTPSLADGGFVGTIGSAGSKTKFQSGQLETEYQISSIRLIEDPGGAAIDVLASTPAPPATWWRKNGGDLENSLHPVDLALLTRTPFSTPSASGNGPGLRDLVEDLGNEACTDVSAPRPLLFDFRGQEPIEAPDQGYLLDGLVCPDNKFASAGMDKTLRVRVPTVAETIPDRPAFFAGSDLPDPEARLADVVALSPDRLDARALLVRTLPASENDLKSREAYTVLRFETGRLATLGEQRTIVLLVALSKSSREGEFRFVHADYDANQKLLDSGDLPASGLETNPTQARILDVLAGTCDVWKESVNAVLELFATERFAQWVPAILRVPVSEKAEIVELGIADGSNAQFGVNGSPGELLLGTAKLLRLQEVIREANDKLWIDRTRERLQDYLDTPGAPPFLLKPDQAYQLEVTYDKRATPDGEATVEEVSVAQSFLFRTSVDPPRSLTPYVLATLPENNAQYAFVSSRPALLLNDLRLFHVLRAHKAAIRVSITRGDGETVRSSDGVITWSEGVLINPAEVILLAAQVTDAEPRASNGGLTIFRPSIAGTPFDEVLIDLIEQGKLRCLNPPESDFENAGLELDVDLVGLRDYNVRIDIVKEDGEAWPFQQAETDAPPAFAFDFTTSLFDSVDEFASSLASAQAQRRVLVNTPVRLDSLSVGDSGLFEVNDDEFDQLVLTIAGTLPLPTEDSDAFYYYRPRTVGMQAKFLLLRTFEPLLRTITFPTWVDPPFAAVDGNDVGILLLEKFVSPLWVPRSRPQVGEDPIRRIVIDSSRERILVEFNDDLSGAISGGVLRLSRIEIPALDVSAQDGPILRSIPSEDLFR